MCKAYHFMGNSYQQNMLMHDDLHHNEYYHQDYDVWKLPVNLFVNFMDVDFGTQIKMLGFFIVNFVIFFMLFHDKI